METQNSKVNYLKAKTKVEKLKAFYIHFTIYVVVNSVLTTVKIMNNSDNDETFTEAFFDFSTFATWLIWGIAIALHAFSVFILPLILGEDWEERKIEKYMKDELENN